MKPVILITCSHEQKQARSGEKLSLGTNYVEAIEAHGGLPLLLPYGVTEEDLEVYLNWCDGILFTGGPDVNPVFYGEEVKYNTVDISDIRDRLEKMLYTKAKATGKPIMGICRGQQIINVLEGGKLFQDLPVEKGVIHMRTYHEATLTKDNFFSHLFGDKIEVNSFHHQGIKELAPDFYVLAKDGDIVEGIAHKKLPIFALQFHPERQIGESRPEKTTDMGKIFTYFIELIKKV